MGSLINRIEWNFEFEIQIFLIFQILMGMFGFSYNIELAPYAEYRKQKTNMKTT